MTWNHTRTGKPMVRTGTYGQLFIHAAMIRHIHPKHPIMIDGQPI